MERGEGSGGVRRAGGQSIYIGEDSNTRCQSLKYRAIVFIAATYYFKYEQVMQPSRQLMQKGTSLNTKDAK
jgi:hypothetical protein